MASTIHQGSLSESRVRRAAEGFNTYCDKERELRRNGDESFDQAAFEAATDLVNRSLDALVGESHQE